MRTRRRWRIALLCTTLVALGLGLVAARVLNGYLGIVFKPKELPSLNPPAPTRPLPALDWRMTDMGAVGILPDPEHWGRGDAKYKHHERRFEDVFLDQPPYLAPGPFARVEEEFRVFVDRMADNGFNAIAIPGFLEFVNFDKVDGGRAIYPEGSVHRERHKALREGFRRLMAHAKSRGMRVVLRTDMVALTTPLEAYLSARFGQDFDTEDPAVWNVYAQGLEEVLEQMPEVDGIILRIGEAGAVYNQPGFDYRSELRVRTDGAVQRMLRAFLDVAERRGKTIIFRTWSVGVGQVGDMHTNPATYERVLDALDSPSLIISTKYGKGDFDGWQPLNPTLMQGRHARIIEFQARREFESFNAYPNYMGPLYRSALLTLQEKNPHVRGLWVWTQDGGPLRSGPLMLYPFHGHWLYVDANVHALARLAEDPRREPRAIAEEWAAQTFGDTPQVRELWADVLLASHPAVMNGLYISDFARWDVRALGLEPPPLLYIFKWDIVGGSTSVMSNIYLVSRERAEASTAEAFAAVNTVRELREKAARAFTQATRGQALEARTLGSLDYMEDLFHTLAWYRRFLFQFYGWLDGGGDSAPWQASLGTVRERMAAHEGRFQGNLDFPAYDFREARTGLVLAERSGATRTAAWVTLGLLVLALGAVVARGGAGQLLRPWEEGRVG